MWMKILGKSKENLFNLLILSLSQLFIQNLTSQMRGFFLHVRVKLNKLKSLKWINHSRLWKLDAGIGLSSQAVARQVFSLKWVFTTVFGMGTGGFLTLGHQRILVNTQCVESCIKIKRANSAIHLTCRKSYILGKALVRLVSVDWICCHTYISDLSTTWSSWGLTDLCHERSHLTVGFVLICFQHLSAWNTATGRLLLAE